MQLPAIQSLWIGNDLSNLEKLCIQSFLDHGHAFHLYTYGKVGGIPKGATVKDANEILPAQNQYQLSGKYGGSYASFSDWFRYALLAKNSGFWVDMDMVCLKPFGFTEEVVLASEPKYVVGSRHKTTTGIIKTPKNHPLVLALAERCANFEDKANSGWGEVGGPQVLAKYVRRHNLQKFVKPPTYFCPTHWSDWYTYLDGRETGKIQFAADTHSIHFYNEILRRHGIDKNAKFHPESVFERLKAKHGIATDSNVSVVIANPDAADYAKTKIADLKRSRRNYVLGVASVALAMGIAIGIAVGQWF